MPTQQVSQCRDSGLHPLMRVSLVLIAMAVRGNWSLHIASCGHGSYSAGCGCCGPSLAAGTTSPSVHPSPTHITPPLPSSPTHHPITHTPCLPHHPHTTPPHHPHTTPPPHNTLLSPTVQPITANQAIVAVSLVCGILLLLNLILCPLAAVLVMVKRRRVRRAKELAQARKEMIEKQECWFQENEDEQLVPPPGSEEDPEIKKELNAEP